MNAMNNALTPAEKYERQKELARLRQKRFYEKNSETIKQKKKSDRMELKQLRTEMGNTQINPPIVPAPAPKRNTLNDLAQYASEDEYEAELTQPFEQEEEDFTPENELETDDEFEFEESEYPFEEWPDTADAPI